MMFYHLNPGTTDNSCDVTDNPAPTEGEIQFILKEIRNYLSPDVNGMFLFLFLTLEANGVG